LPNNAAQQIWKSVFEAGKANNIKPIGLAARDTLRLEMGFCLYGNDIDDTTSPIEAGLGWITKFTSDFNNADFLEEQKSNGVSQRKIGFELLDRGIPRKDYEIIDSEENVIGRVTSGTMSPSLKKAIGMGYVARAHTKSGNIIYIKVRNKSLKAQVVKLPFYKA